MNIDKKQTIKIHKENTDINELKIQYTSTGSKLQYPILHNGQNDQAEDLQDHGKLEQL